MKLLTKQTRRGGITIKGHQLTISSTVLRRLQIESSKKIQFAVESTESFGFSIVQDGYKMSPHTKVKNKKFTTVKVSAVQLLKENLKEGHYTFDGIKQHGGKKFYMFKIDKNSENE